MAKIHELYNFYLNHERVSEPVDVHSNTIEPIENDWQEFSRVSTLVNQLDIVIKQPGIYPTSEIVKLDPKLYTFFNRLPAYSQINEECISPYYPPGQDQNLQRMAAQFGCKYMMSTSTVSSILSHIYYAISNHKSPHFNNLSEAYDREALKFMISQRKPNTIFLTQVDRHKKLYSIDGDSGFIEPSNVVLLKMGKYMEKMLTTDWKYFNDHYVLDLKTNRPKVEMSREDKDKLYEEDYFRYMRSGKLFLRS